MLGKKALFCMLVLLICSPLLWSQPLGGTSPAVHAATSASAVAQLLQPHAEAKPVPPVSPLAAVQRSWKSVKTMFR